MKVRLNHRWARPEGNHGPGEIIDVDPTIARQLVDGGHAANVDPFPIETATLKPKETATSRRKRP